MEKPKSVLITGASGFIGSFLVEEAIRQGYQVHAGIRKTSSRKYLTDERIQFFEMDLSSPEILKSQLVKQFESGGFDYIIHNAGLTYAPVKSDFEKVNANYARNLTEALSATVTNLQKFVLISSLSVHGPGHPTSFQPIIASDSKRPISAYAKSKLSGEEIIQNSSLPFVILRPTAVYGPRDQDFFQLVKLIHRGYDLSIGTHLQMTSLIYVEDLARAVVTALQQIPAGKSYLLSDGEQYYKTQLGDAIARVMNRRPFKLKLPTGMLLSALSIIDLGYKLLGNQAFLNPEKVREISAGNWLCDSSQIWNDLRIAPEYTLESGISKTIKWYESAGWLPGAASKH